MMRNNIFLCLYFGMISLTWLACKESKQDDSTNEPNQKKEAFVHVTSVTDTIHFSNEITLNATASYLLKTDIKANTTGYIVRMSVKLGDGVQRGETLFSLQTKEARAIGSTINQLDSSFRFHGYTSIFSPATGYVAMVNHQPGDFVQEGEVLATISDASSFGFVTDVPFEYLQIFKNKKTFPVELSDGRTIQGVVTKIMPTADPVSQTVKVLLRVPIAERIPENLIGNIRFSKDASFGIAVPKSAVATDETQSAFWVMKMINDTMAIKISIEKGVETDQWIQVKSGNIKPLDKVISSGNFGLGDTIQVRVEK